MGPGASNAVRFRKLYWAERLATTTQKDQHALPYYVFGSVQSVLPELGILQAVVQNELYMCVELCLQGSYARFFLIVLGVLYRRPSPPRAQGTHAPQSRSPSVKGA